MKVSELITKLQELDPECHVVLSSDDEGNSYRLLHAIEDNSAYILEGRYAVEVGIHVLTPELQKAGYSEEDVVKGKPCIVLF